MLDLVISGMGETDLRNPVIPADLGQCCVPQRAADHLQTLPASILSIRYADAVGHEPDSEHRTCALHEILIQVRFLPSQPVIDMSYQQQTRIHPLDPGHGVQHPHRVTPAGNGNDQRFTRRYATSE